MPPGGSRARDSREHKNEDVAKSAVAGLRKHRFLLVLRSGGESGRSSGDRAPKELVFDVVKIDGPVHDPAQHTFWFGPFAECSSILDINGDGKLDIAAGRNYYLAPNWTKHADYRDGAPTNGPDVDDNYECTLDVNNDGRMDVISSGWMLKSGRLVV